MLKATITPERARALIAHAGVRDKVAVLGLRGFLATGGNKRNIYDDALVIVAADGVYAYNANTDPSVNRTGVAVLRAGVWHYKPGIHGLSKPKAQQYQAFVQAGKVIVARDGQGNDTGFFGINIHRGGNSTTSSLGCQTIVPSQWEAFRSKLMHELQVFGQEIFSYVLVEGERA